MSIRIVPIKRVGYANSVRVLEVETKWFYIMIYFGIVAGKFEEEK